jgi:hypothetical protein
MTLDTANNTTEKIFYHADNIFETAFIVAAILPISLSCSAV